MENQTGFLLILTAPSGAGKTTIRDGILKRHPEIQYSVSMTTRKPRNGEENGKDYFFVDENEFKKNIENNELLEWAKVHDHYYGTPKGFIEEGISKGNIVIMDIDIQGGLNIKKNFQNAVFIFILPPSFDTLEKRLRERNTETDDTIKLRLENAKKEIALMNEYDYIVVNDDINSAIAQVGAIISSEKIKTKRNSDFVRKYLK